MEPVFIDREVYISPQGSYTCEAPMGMGYQVAAPAGKSVEPEKLGLDRRKLIAALAGGAAKKAPAKGARKR